MSQLIPYEHMSLGTYSADDLGKFKHCHEMYCVRDNVINVSFKEWNHLIVLIMI